MEAVMQTGLRQQSGKMWFFLSVMVFDLVA